MFTAGSQRALHHRSHAAADRLTAGCAVLERAGERHGVSDWTRPAWRQSKPQSLKLRERGRRVRSSRRSTPNSNRGR